MNMEEFKCPVCEGRLLERWVQDGPIIYGPGNQMKRDGYYCEECGLMFQHMSKSVYKRLKKQMGEDK